MKRIKTWLGRFLLVFLSSEFALSLVSIPPKYEAGIWHGNSYRERLALQTWPLSEDFNDLGYRDIDWNKKLTIPLLLLDATDDKLVNSEINKQLLEKSKLTTVVSIKAQHEIMMEKNEIRTIAWKAIDEFLNP